jgi:CBS domain-containing protein
MKVAALLRNKGDEVATIHPHAPVRDAVAAMGARNIGALVVSSGEGTISGIVSERDVVRWLDRRGPEILGEVVEAIMSTDVRTCAPDDELSSLMALMTERRIRHVPVLVKGRLGGIISIGDVVKSRLGELEDDRCALYDYINAR